MSNLNFVAGDCEPPKRTLSEAKSARRGELIGRVKICTAIKLRFEKKKFVRFLAKTASPVNGMYLIRIGL